MKAEGLGKWVKIWVDNTRDTYNTEHRVCSTYTYTTHQNNKTKVND